MSWKTDDVTAGSGKIPHRVNWLITALALPVLTFTFVAGLQGAGSGGGGARTRVYVADRPGPALRLPV